MENSMKLRGQWTLEAADATSGRILWRRTLKNQLTEINRIVRTQMLLGTFAGTTDALAIKYIAFGDGTAAPSAADTALGNERYRKQVTRMEAADAATVRTTLSLGTGEANFTIREIGVFCGPDASADAGSGTLLSRIAVNINKSSSIVLNLTRSDICTI